ncbi:MAG TPA: hypothetical protein VNL70_04930 [Tepidisphaeraceae bacterium]|nr:hypothetical protein [Tepidisphaeraceae bacterium]
MHSFKRLPAWPGISDVLACLIGGLMALAATQAPAQVTIDRTEPIVERRSFDPQNPPQEMPRLDPKEAAVTQSFFGVETRVGGTVVQQTKLPDGQCRASIKVDQVHMTLRLRITIWLPSDAVPKLINHEEGHRRISEHFYQDAERIAREQAQALIGTIVVGSGRDCQTAGDNALKQAAQELGGRYLGKTDVPAGKAQELYDQLTAHGTNAVREDRAVRQAIEQATRPPGSQAARD